MSHEIQTPILRQAAKALLDIIDSAGTGAMEIKEATQVIKACNGISNMVATDLKARLAAPKLNKIELELKANKAPASIESKVA